MICILLIWYFFFWYTLRGKSNITPVVHRPHRQTALPASELEESSGGGGGPSISPVSVVVQDKAPPKQLDHKGAKCEFIQMKVKFFDWFDVDQNQRWLMILFYKTKLRSWNEKWKLQNLYFLAATHRTVLRGESTNGEGGCLIMMMMLVAWFIGTLSLLSSS